MGAKRIFVRAVMGTFLFAVCLSPAFAQEAWEKAAATTYEHGWFLESSDKNYDGALDAYRKLIERFGDDKKYCALAQARIGACLDALGKSDEARAAWQKALADYPDQPEAVKNARLLMAGLDPLSVGGLEEMKKQAEGILNSPSPWSGTNSQIMSTLAAAYPAEAAEFLHAKLVELGKSGGPVLAQGKMPWKDPQMLSVIGICLQALASCDAEKTRDYLLDLLKHAGDAEGQFLGKGTAHSIIISFVYLWPPYVNDEVVDIVIKDINEGVESLARVAMFGWPFMPTPMFYAWPQDGRYALAVFADFNAKALDFLKTEAVNAADEKGATLAMLFMARLRKPETAAFYTGIATGKFPEKIRLTAIACLGGLGEPRHLPLKTTTRFEEDATLFQFVQWRLNSKGGAWYQSYQMYQKGKIVEPGRALLDECVKGLKAAYDFNNSVSMRGEVITAFELLGRGAAKEPLLDYAKNAVDPEVREMAARALGDLFEFSEKDADVAGLLDGLMKGDSALSVRVQAAWALSKLSHPVGQVLGPHLLTREAIPVMLEALQEYKGTPPSTTGNIALGISQTDALNSMLVTTFHGERVTPDYGGASGPAATATDEFAKWWEANKDKSDAEWAMAGMDEWVKKTKESLAVGGYAVFRMAIEPYVNKLIDSEVGRISAYTPESQKEQAKAVCDWWEKNRDKVAWNGEKRCFEIRQGSE